MGAERARQFLLVASAIDGHRPETLTRSKLNGEMAEAADAVDRDNVPRSGSRVAEGVERGDPCTEQRRGGDNIQIPGHVCERRDARQHVGGVAAVAGHAGDLLHILACEGAVAPTARTIAAGAAEPADAYAHSNRPSVDVGAERLDGANHFVSRHARVLDARHEPFDGQRVTVADPARGDPNTDFLSSRLRQRALFKPEAATCARDGHHPHHCHGFFLLTHTRHSFMS